MKIKFLIIFFVIFIVQNVYSQSVEKKIDFLLKSENDSVRYRDYLNNVKITKDYINDNFKEEGGFSKLLTFNSLNDFNDETAFYIYFIKIIDKDKIKYVPLYIETEPTIDTTKTHGAVLKNKIKKVVNYSKIIKDTLLLDYLSEIISKKFNESFNTNNFNIDETINLFNKKRNFYNREQLINYYLNEKINDKYWYPINFNGNNLLDSFQFALSVSFSSLNLSFNKFIDNIKILPAGFEVSTQEDILNVLPFQSNSIKIGSRFLIPLDFKGKIFKVDQPVLDARFYYRFNKNMSYSFFNKLFSLENSKLNFGEGFGADFLISSFFGLPIRVTGFWTKEKFDNPISKIQIENGYKSYFTFFQLMNYFSFYKSLDKNARHRISLDIGGSTYNVREAFYDNNMKLSNVNNLSWKYLPFINFNYNLVLNDTILSKMNLEPVLGFSTKFYEERFKIMVWISLINFLNAENYELRIESFYISEPIRREIKVYENIGGTFFQLHFKYKIKL